LAIGSAAATDAEGVADRGCDRPAKVKPARKTREKIALGGLIAKAGLRYEKRALLLGLLIVFILTAADSRRR